jgi:hypothetical protein
MTIRGRYSPRSKIDHGALTGLTGDHHTQYHNDSRAATWLAANHETTYTHADIALNTTHRSSNGTDHNYINQPVTTNSSVTFATVNIPAGNELSWDTDTVLLYLSTGPEEPFIIYNDNGPVEIQNDVNITNSGSLNVAGSIAAGSIYFNVSGHENFVGIGTEEPSEALHVVGNILASGTITGTTISGANANWDAAYTHSQLTSGNPHSVTPAELSLVIGTNVQAWDTQLDDLSTITSTAAAIDSHLGGHSDTVLWSEVNKTVSSIADITTKNHTDLTAGDGSDHTFINQNVTTTGTPTFSSLTANALSFGSADTDTIESSTGTIDLTNEHLTTTGNITGETLVTGSSGINVNGGTGSLVAIKAQADNSTSGFRIIDYDTTHVPLFAWQANDVGHFVLRDTNVNKVYITANGDGYMLGGNFGVGVSSPTARLHVDNVSGAVPVLKLDQGDIDDSFIDFVGTSAADGSRSISSDTTENSAKFGAIRVEINGVTKWIRIYDDHS